MVIELPGRAVVLGPALQRRLVKRIDRGPVFGLKRQVVASGQLTLRGFAFGSRPEELIGLGIVFARSPQWPTKQE